MRTSLPFPSVYAVTGGRESGGRWFVIPPELTSPCDRRLLKPAARAPWEIAHPPITREMLDAADLSPRATELANRLPRALRALSEAEVEELHLFLDRAGRRDA